MKTVIWNQRMGRKLSPSDQLSADMVSDDPEKVKRARSILVRRWRKIERERGTARPEFVAQVQSAVTEAHRNPMIAGFAEQHPVLVQSAAVQRAGEIAPQADYDPGTKRIVVYDHESDAGSHLEKLDHGDVTAADFNNRDITTASHGRDVAVYRHEFGHHVQDTLDSDPRVQQFQTEWNNYRNEYETDLAASPDYEARKAVTASLLSYYSTTNWREGFAEAWTITTSPGFSEDQIDDRYSPSGQRLLHIALEVARDHSADPSGGNGEGHGGAGAGGEPDRGRSAIGA